MLHAWLRTYGSTDPLAHAPPAPRALRAARPAPVVRPPTHLVFGDSHAAPDQDLGRFRAMGAIVRAEADRAAAEGRALVVVQIGDWYSFDSLCEHETAAKRSEGTVRAEIEAGELALEAFHAGAGAASIAALGDHVTAYVTEGNHDKRVAALADDAPWLDGLYTVGAAHEARGWGWVPFLRPLRRDGVRYQHYLTSRGGARAIGGVNHARTMLARVHYGESVVVGHSHALAYHTEASHLGVRRHSIVVGAWLDHVEEYAREDNQGWWTGHVVLRGVVDGDAESVEFHRR